MTSSIDAAVVAGDDAEDGADHRDQQPRPEADGERHAGAVEQPREDVVADAGGAEPVVGRRRLVRPADALGRAVLGEQRARRSRRG